LERQLEDNPMAERTTCGCGPVDVPADQVSKTVDEQLASLDPQRADAFDKLLSVRAARGAGYAREQKRLARKYGPDHPRVAALADKIRFNDGLRRDVGFEAARARIESPAVDKTGYVFHGFVRDRAGQGVPRLTIALYDETGNWIRELGYGCTDERGYFLMRYQRAQTEPRVEAPIFLRRAAGEAKPVARIYVLDSKKATLQIEKQPLCPQLGEVDFRIIVLGAETAPCTPPPPEAGEPAPPPTPTSTPLENIRGIGPARARKLRAAGIKDVETLLETDTSKLVEIAGFDANFKREAAAALKRAKKK
jgi:predicted flap endonuclease-1-like 5' DNA nuclease